MVAYPTCVSQVGNLDGNRVHCCSYLFLALFAQRAILIKGYTRHFLGEYVTWNFVSIKDFMASGFTSVRCLFSLLLHFLTVARNVVLDPKQVSHRLRRRCRSYSTID